MTFLNISGSNIDVEGQNNLSMNKIRIITPNTDKSKQRIAKNNLNGVRC